MAVWHRRAGKDELCLHHAATAMMQRAGNYWHMLPLYSQARKAVWDAVNPHTGRRRIDEAFPLELRESTRDHDMQIRMLNGSTWQCIASDEYSRTVGSSAAGVVFSEYALANPSAWGYIRPMIEENNGWAIFITTPRGRNHALDMAKFAQGRDDWFYEILTARDTGALTEDQLNEALAEYVALYGEDMGNAQFQQEYMCSFNAAVLGAFFALEMQTLRAEGRILDTLEALPDQYVHRAWDLGVRDDTSIWWFQAQGSQLVVLDHYAASGMGVEHFAEVIERKGREHGWLHGTDYVPHDAKVKEFGTGRTRVETMQSLGLRPMLVPLTSLQDGINAVRRTLPLTVFHSRCEFGGIDALEQYRREWDDDKKAFRASPLHDWTSHPADAFRYLAQSWRLAPRRVIEAPKSEGWVILPPPEPRQRGIQL
jgi:hypothetical protein